MNLNLNNNCRFCLRLILEREKIRLSAEICEQFENITNLKIQISEIFPKSICSNCRDEIFNCNKVRTKLRQNQERLHEMLNEHKTMQLENFLDEIKQETEFVDENECKNLGDDFRLNFETAKLEPETIITPSNSNPNNKFQAKQKKKSAKSSTTETTDKSLICHECGKLLQKRKYKEHFERVHLKICRFFCDLCTFKNYSKDKLIYHMKTHMNLRDVQCQFCEKTFNTRGSMISHRDRYHLKKYQKSCLQCNKTFTTTILYKNHVRTIHEKILSFKCDIPDCDKAYATKNQLCRHKRRHHTSPVSCPICSKSFPSQVALGLHIKRHDAKYMCEKCDRRFPCNFTLTQHLRTHENIRNHSCPHCDMAFFRPGTLNNHIRVAHMKIRYPCLVPGCTVTSSGKAGVRRHIIRNHKNLGDDKLKEFLEKIRSIVNPPPIMNSNEIALVDESFVKSRKRNK